MRKISDAIREVVSRNQFLQFGLSQNLLNLTQVARFIKPLVESRTKKEVQVSAILMNLSRYKNQENEAKPKVDQFKVRNISINSNLCVLTFVSSREIHKKVNALHTKIYRQGGYITITEGISEITIIIEDRFYDLLKSTIEDRPLIYNKQISSLSVQFDPKYLELPGFIYLILQQIAFQNINLIEVVSTGTEFILYIEEKNVHLAFDTIYSSFQKNDADQPSR